MHLQVQVQVQGWEGEVGLSGRANLETYINTNHSTSNSLFFFVLFFYFNVFQVSLCFRGVFCFILLLTFVWWPSFRWLNESRVRFSFVPSCPSWLFHAILSYFGPLFSISVWVVLAFERSMQVLYCTVLPIHPGSQRSVIVMRKPLWLFLLDNQLNECSTWYILQHENVIHDDGRQQ